jgi:hypothetical protein
MTNCSFCHSGQIGGRIIPGLGSRELRLNALNSAVVDVVKRPDFNAKTLLPLAKAAARRRGTPWGWRQSWGTKTAISQLKKRSGTEMGNAFGGMKDVDGGPGRNSAIEFAKAASKVPIAPPYSFSKYPAVWVYRKRSTFGYDGSIVGDRAMALSAVEFNKRMPPGDLVKRREMWESVYAYLLTLQPPPYPGAVDSALAERGHEVFVATCAKCHGTYRRGDDPGHYQEKVVSLSVVGTDGDRLHSVTPELMAARRKGPLARYVHLEARRARGAAARRHLVSPHLQRIGAHGRGPVAPAPRASQTFTGRHHDLRLGSATRRAAGQCVAGLCLSRCSFIPRCRNSTAHDSHQS